MQKPRWLKSALSLRYDSGRNHQLNASSFAMGQLADAGLDRQDAEERLFTAAQANGYVAKDGAAAARATIRSGFDAGVLQPRSIPNGAAATNKAAARPVLSTGVLSFRRSHPAPSLLPQAPMTRQRSVTRSQIAVMYIVAEGSQYALRSSVPAASSSIYTAWFIPKLARPAGRQKSPRLCSHPICGCGRSFRGHDDRQHHLLPRR